MANETLKALWCELRLLQDKYRFFQRGQEYAKLNYNNWDPYDGLTKYEHERRYAYEIIDNKIVLNALEHDIKTVRKRIKQFSRELNKGM